MRRHSRLWHSRRVWLVTASAAAVFIAGFGTSVRTQNARGNAAAPPAAQGAGGAGANGGGRGRIGAPGGDTTDFTPTTPYLPRTAAEEAKGFRLPAGYRMELVASDPDVISPTIIEFDGNGRMYVGEMIGYMQDAEASREHDPVSR
ncbi:MAG TPA: hypothetical protein VHB78_12635, partial [Vicinamibacterales bacterium]|nr:hypothetical protein [Vicinamibacterales bacterium]